MIATANYCIKYGLSMTEHCVFCFAVIGLETITFTVTSWTALDPTQPEDSGVLERDAASLSEWLLM